MRSTLTAVTVVAAVLTAACADFGPERAVAPAPALNGSTVSLLSCATDTTWTVSATVGSEGGEFSRQGHRVKIPAGAVPQPTRFTLTVPASQYAEIDVRADGASHYTFAKPVTVTISYAGCGAAGGNLTAWYWDAASGSLIQRMSGVDDPSKKAVTFTTDHFSGYVIAN